MIELSDVTKRYPGGHEAVSHLSLTIEQGELVFLTGHSGAGKSTLLKLVAAIERPTVGHVIVNNQNVGRMKSCWCSTPTSARTRWPRSRHSTKRSASPAWS